MSVRLLLLFPLLLTASVCLAQADAATERVELRVTSTGEAVVIDRGTRDGLEVGDVVTFLPRDGSARQGTVTSVDERSAVIELDDRNFVPEPGMRGEVHIPAERFAEEGNAPESAEPTEPAVEHPPWENEDDDFSPEMPLLTQLGAIKPKERPQRFTARAYVVANLTENPSSDFRNSFWRSGADAIWTNPLGHGGRFRVNAELDYLTFVDDNQGWDLLLRRLSYTQGGDRFTPTRWEAGRFLHWGMPEFGVLDGFEWGIKTSKYHRWGFSIGFLPEPDDKFSAFNDMQLAAYYEWVADVKARFTIAAGFQKTWHKGKSDRDLLVGRFRYLPADHWDLSGTFWIDFYTGGDDYKDSFLELTGAVVLAKKRWIDRAGIDLTWVHRRFPDIMREGEFLPPLQDGIERNRLDRLGFSGFKWLADDKQIHGHLSGWNDEDGSGGATDLGLEVRDLFVAGSRTDLTLYGTAAQFENVVGGRISFGRFIPHGRWDVLYDLANHHTFGFPDDRNDLLQHRLRISGRRSFPGGFELSAYAEGALYDDEFSWTLGVNLQKRF